MNFRNLNNLGKGIPISFPKDSEGYFGRECPKCEGYFKVVFGTGLKTPAPCCCPYCGHKAEQGKFWTKDQLNYAKSIAARKVTEALTRDLSSSYGSRNRVLGSGNFGISLTLEFKSNPRPIHYYREKQLETAVTCENCTLQYAVYGVFAFCPDCGMHNSLQILNKNFDLIRKEIALASSAEKDFAEFLVNNALGNAVSAFDGFGREVCRLYSHKASSAEQAVNISFQNLKNAEKNVSNLFGFNISSAVDGGEWEFVCRCFQKRHLIAHKAGVVDDAYIDSTGDTEAIVGRKLIISPHDVERLVELLKKIGDHLVSKF